MALLTWEYPPEVTGGLGIACEGIARALDRLTGVEVITPAGEAVDPYDCDPEDLEGGEYGALVLQRAAHADVVHAHDWMTFPAAMAWARQTGRPWVAHVHSLEIDRSGGMALPEIREIEGAGLRMADAVIAVSHRTAARCVDEYGVSPEKLHVVHNGIEPVKPWRHETGVPRVSFIGRLTWQKAPDDFVEIAARIAEMNKVVQFTMAGRGEMGPELVERIAKHGLTRRFEMPGFIGREAVRALLARTDVLCMPSREEPFGLVALEAAAFAVPAVISTTAGVGELLPAARHVEAGDVEGFAGRIWGLVVDPEWRRELGERSQLQAKWATWDRTAAAVIEVLRQVI
ncbi:glycogen synthase [Haloferula sargassicola]|uniref:Glycogen synthase n=1 Tax=Haloferula sargassicola TaxID=490096 RepID=A0ABP9UN89_9BACT